MMKCLIVKQYYVTMAMILYVCNDVCVYAEAPKALHLTKSVYIRHIAPNVSSTDILEV